MDLTAPVGAFTYYWNDVETDNALLTIETSGTYRLKMENICGTDSTQVVIEQHELPDVNLGDDQLLFPDESITLDAGVYQTYEWNNDPNFTDQFFTVNANDVSGDTVTIVVKVNDGYCTNKDGVFIEVFKIRVPSVITPNGDEYNNEFKPFEEGWAGIHDHTISVFNRWGEKVWESNDFPSGWDGKHNGTLVADGTYFWVLEVNYGPENLSKSYKGTLSVLGSGN
jgi:gliding motility-associated-like protein